MNKYKQHIIGAVIGIVVFITGYLGYIFYKSITTLTAVSITTQQLVVWVCKQDPASCGQTTQKPTEPVGAKQAVN